MSPDLRFSRSSAMSYSDRLCPCVVCAVSNCDAHDTESPVRNLLMAKVKSGLFTSRLITEMFNCRIPVSRVCSTIFLYLICIFSGTQ